MNNLLEGFERIKAMNIDEFAESRLVTRGQDND